MPPWMPMCAGSGLSSEPSLFGSCIGFLAGARTQPADHCIWWGAGRVFIYLIKTGDRGSVTAIREGAGIAQVKEGKRLPPCNEVHKFSTSLPKMGPKPIS